MLSLRFSRHSLPLLFAALISLSSAVSGATNTAPANAFTLSVGVQPLGYPSGIISSVMARDRILRAALAKRNGSFEGRPFARGADIVPELNAHRLQAGLLGDMPTLLAIANGSHLVVGLVKQTSTALVTRNISDINGLAGKRVGYVENSSAHHTLLQGLESAGLKAHQIKLMPMRIDDMPDALERGEIEGFAGWEPAPSLALNRNPANRIIFRGQSTDYLVFDKAFVEQTPDIALELTAAFVRSIEWMRRSRANQEKAARWVQSDGERYAGKPVSARVEQIVTILRRDILNVPSAPAIPGIRISPPLRSEFEFLKRQGKLDGTTSWDTVTNAFRYDGLAQVIADSRHFRTQSFDYDE